MTPEEVDAALAAMSDMAGRIEHAESDKDRDTMTVARKQHALYESRVWVDEWLEQKPPPTNRFALSRFKADSMNRFNQWAAWKQEQRGGRYYGSQYSYKFEKAVTIESFFARAKFDSERVIRPLAWLVKYKMAHITLHTTPATKAGALDAIRRAHRACGVKNTTTMEGNSNEQ